MGAGGNPISAESIVVFRGSVIREFTLEAGQQDLINRVELESVRHGTNSTRFFRCCRRSIAITRFDPDPTEFSCFER
jgi:hypothetical protein